MNLKNQEKQWLLGEKYKGKECPEFFTDVEKLGSGTPLAYLIGNIPFSGLTIDLENKPLIPRPETEYWVDYVLKKFIPENQPFNILDIFSGSGCIGLVVAKKRPKTHVLCSEIKKENISQIEKNRELNNIPKEQVTIMQSDEFQNIPPQKFDYIFANPPYISQEKIETVEQSVLEHEDHGALFAKDDGLFFVKKCIDSIPNFLKENGYMFVEFDPWQEEILTSYATTKNISFDFLKDQYEKTRVVILKNKNLT